MTEVSNKKSNLSRYIVPSIKNDVENIPAYITKMQTRVFSSLYKMGHLYASGVTYK